MRYSLATPAFFVSLISAAPTTNTYIPPVSDALQNILKNTDKSENYKYPTDFTREIVPVRFFPPSVHAEIRGLGAI